MSNEKGYNGLNNLLDNNGLNSETGAIIVLSGFIITTAAIPIIMTIFNNILLMILLGALLFVSTEILYFKSISGLINKPSYKETIERKMACFLFTYSVFVYELIIIPLLGPLLIWAGINHIITINSKKWKNKYRS